MKNEKIKYNGRFKYIEDEKIRNRCEYITVLFENYTKYNGIVVRSINYKHFLKEMAYNENYKIIAVAKPEQGCQDGQLYKEPIEDNGSIFDIFGNEYKVYSQECGRWRRNYFIVDPDSELHLDGCWFNRIEDYDDPKDFIEDINSSWR